MTKAIVKIRIPKKTKGAFDFSKREEPKPVFDFVHRRKKAIA